MKGWTKATLGVGLLLLGKFVWDKVADKIKDLGDKLKETASTALKVGGDAVEKATSVVKNAAEADDDKKEKAKSAIKDAGKEVLSGVAKEVFDKLTSIAKETFEKVLGQAAIAAVSAFAGPIGPFITGISKIVGNMGFIVETISPITNSFISKYNQIAAAPAAPALAEQLGQVITQKNGVTTQGGTQRVVKQAVGLREQRILLTNILYDS